jgi:hypothetical protein
LLNSAQFCTGPVQISTYLAQIVAVYEDATNKHIYDVNISKLSLFNEN